MAIAILLFSTPPAFADGDARGFVEQYITAAKRIRTDATLPPDQKDAQSQALLHDAYDFAGAPRAILGRHWAKASSDQQRRYLEQFERYIIAAYAKRFDAIATTLTVTGSSIQDTRAIVRSTTTSSDGGPLQIDWVLVRPDGADWRIADVIVNGVGSVETMRQEFSSVLRTNHDDIEILLSALQQRIATLQAGQ